MANFKAFYLSCLMIACISLQAVNSQGTGKVQEFFKKYFGEYFPKTTRSYTLYGNGLNGPADYNAGLPLAEDIQGPIKSNLIIRRGSPTRNSQGVQQQQPSGQQLQQRVQQYPSQVPFALDNAWQPSPNFDPVAFAKGGHRGRSDLTEEFDAAESRIITADDILEAGDGTREFRIESTMSFSPGTVHQSDVKK